MEWIVLAVQLIILAGVGTLILLTRNYLPSYANEKGKNLATREDVHEITDKIESVKAEYAKEIESLKSHLTAKSQILTLRYVKLTELKEKIAQMKSEGSILNILKAASTGDNPEEECMKYLRGLESQSRDLETMLLTYSHLFSIENRAKIKEKVEERGTYEITFVQDLSKVKELSDNDRKRALLESYAAKCNYHSDSMHILLTLVEEELEQVTRQIESGLPDLANPPDNQGLKQ